jgi:hypothetical protein
MIIVEEFVACDDATGCWEFRGGWPQHYNYEGVELVTKAVINDLILEQHEAWAYVGGHDHPGSFFEDRAKQEFQRCWRVRQVPTHCVVKPK